MSKPLCRICENEMGFVMDNKVRELWECPKCGILLLVNKNGAPKVHRWYEKIPHIA